jgi:hypothetical protein
VPFSRSARLEPAAVYTVQVERLIEGGVVAQDSVAVKHGPVEFPRAACIYITIIPDDGYHIGFKRRV